MKLIKRILLKNLLTLVLIFSVESCANVGTKVIEPEFQDYAKDFVSLMPEYKEKVSQLGIGFRVFPENKKYSEIVGQCTYNFFYGNSIGIDRKYWETASPTSKYFTLLHEMAHCVCYVGHSESTKGWLGIMEEILFKIGIWKKKGYLWDGCPASIMHPSEFGDFCAWNYYYYYIEELKNSCRNRNAK